MAAEQGTVASTKEPEPLSPSVTEISLFSKGQLLHADDLNQAFARTRRHAERLALRHGAIGLFRPAGAPAATLTITSDGRLIGTGIWIVDDVGRTLHFDAIEHPASKLARIVAIAMAGGMTASGDEAGFELAALRGGSWAVTAQLACLVAVDRVENALADLTWAARSWRSRLLEPGRMVDPVDHVAAAPVLVSFDQAMQPDLGTIDVVSAFHRLTSFAALARHALRASDPASFGQLTSAPEATVDATEAWLKTWTLAFSANGVLDRLLITGTKLPRIIDTSRRGLRGQVRCEFAIGVPQPAMVRLSFSGRPPPVQWGFDDGALCPLRETSRVGGSPDEWLYDLPIERRAQSLVVIGPEDTQAEGRVG